MTDPLGTVARFSRAVIAGDESAERRALDDLAAELGLDRLTITTDRDGGPGTVVSEPPLEELDAPVADVLQVVAGIVTAARGRRAEAVYRQRLVEILDRRLGYERALATCARALLGDTASGMERALEALLEVTGAHHAFVDLNEEHPEWGLCARTVAAVNASGHDHDFDVAVVDPVTGDVYEDVWPYEAMPSVLERLAVGDPAVVVADRLPPGRERDLYVAAGIASELNLPIVVDGRWIGSIGFSLSGTPRRWRAREVDLLGAAAQMFAAYFQRRRDRERLEELLASKDEFLASVSHELRTPLTVVVGLARELAERDGEFEDAERRELLSMLSREAEDVADLVEDLLVAVQGDRELGLTHETVGVAEIIGSVVRHLGIDGIEVRGEATARVDPLRLRQVLRNLLTNAQRYGGPSRVVEVAEDGDLVVVTISDDGHGVPSEAAQRIFEPYGRAGPKLVPSSLGLGLTVSRRLARLMGGDLVYERRDGWTVFRLTVPAG